MRFSNRLRVLMPLSLAAGRLLPTADTTAQEASPVAANPPATPEVAQLPGTPAPTTVEGLSIVATGLPYPRGMTWGPDGELYVGVAGDSVSPATSSGETPVEKVFGTFHPVYAAAVVRIVDGCGNAVATGMPSEYQDSGWHQGIADVTFLDGVLYALNDGSGAARGHTDYDCGLYAIDMDGGWAMAGSLDIWMPENPVAHVPGDLDPSGEPFGMVEGDGFIYVAESNSGQMLKMYPNGTIERFVDLSDGHPVPTGPAKDKEGNLYVGGLTAAPYVDGDSYVFKITPDGEVTKFWTGLTMVTSVAVGPDGTLYALEMATGNTTTPPFATPMSGKVVRMTGPDSSEDVVTGLDYPIAMKTGPDGALYVSTPAVGMNPNGAIIRVDPTAPVPMAWDESMLSPSTCPPIPQASRGAGAPSSESAAKPTPTDDAVPTAGAGESDATAVEGDAVTIENYAFSPIKLSAAAGTTVTWTNKDSTPHTVTADDGSFDSGNLGSGDTWTYTFKVAGTFAYHCNYHPAMKGAVTIK